MDYPPPKPLVRLGLPSFFAVCILSGLLIGHGLGRGATQHPLWYALAAAGVALNAFGFIMRKKTRDYETYETVEKIIQELKEELKDCQ